VLLLILFYAAFFPGKLDKKTRERERDKHAQTHDIKRDQNTRCSFVIHSKKARERDIYNNKKIWVQTEAGVDAPEAAATKPVKKKCQRKK